jgi:hypothetical protein
MQIIDYTYRKPKYLDPISPTQIDTIVMHNTSNYNSIDTNTDYHIDHNAWNWNGYGYYLVRGLIYKVRGMEYQNAAVRGHNHHTVNIAIEGNYDIDHLTEVNIKALEWLIGHLKKENDNIQYVKGHRNFNNTSCPGKNIDTNKFAQFLEKDDKCDILLRDNELLKTQNNYLVTEIERLDRIIRKDREKYDELKKIYKDNLEELQKLR